MNIAERVRISHEIAQLLRQIRDLVLAGENLERSGASGLEESATLRAGKHD